MGRTAAATSAGESVAVPAGVAAVAVVVMGAGWSSSLVVAYTPASPSATLEAARAVAVSYARSGAARGSSTRNVAPQPGALSTSTSPPWAATRAATIARPSPAPPRERERAGSAR